MTSDKKLRLVVAGQTPPPLFGQNIMIHDILNLVFHDPEIEADHLNFCFNIDLKQIRKVNLTKIWVLCKIIVRLLLIRLSGKIDCLIFPVGGPYQRPIYRDLILLPWCYLTSRHVILHFHAAGIARALPHLSPFLRWLVLRIYRYSTGAIVMTKLGKEDPHSLGIIKVIEIPNWLSDTYDSKLLRRGTSKTVNILCVGLITPEKGTPALLQAFSRFHKQHPECKLVLVGECLPPYTESRLQNDIENLNLKGSVEVTGVLTGDLKWRRFVEADLYIFPTVAPQESFGRVMVEAMMWALPVVATDWRGNTEVLGDNPGGIYVPIEPDLVLNLTAALERAFEQKDNWKEWGTRNRARFLNCYDKSMVAPDFIHYLKSMQR